MTQFDGKTAFLTGGAGGFGMALAHELGRRGARIMLADINQDSLDKAVGVLADAGIEADGIRCDVTDPASMDAAAAATQQRFGPVHFLFNNAGVVSAGHIEQHRIDDFAWVYAVNVFGTVNGIRAFLPGMRAHGEPARIVNTASIAGLKGMPAGYVYCSSKAAVVNLTQSLRSDLAGTTIGVSLLCPGWMRTAFFDSGTTRHDRFGGPSDFHQDTDATTREILVTELSAGQEPADIARIVMRGIEEDRFLIMTHPQDQALIQDVRDEVDEAFGWLHTQLARA